MKRLLALSASALLFTTIMGGSASCTKNDEPEPAKEELVHNDLLGTVWKQDLSDREGVIVMSSPIISFPKEGRSLQPQVSSREFNFRSATKCEIIEKVPFGTSSVELSYWLEKPNVLKMEDAGTYGVFTFFISPDRKEMYFSSFEPSRFVYTFESLVVDRSTPIVRATTTNGLLARPIVRP